VAGWLGLRLVVAQALESIQVAFVPLLFSLRRMEQHPILEQIARFSAIELQVILFQSREDGPELLLAPLEAELRRRGHNPDETIQ
jgi:hypothetical protein